MKWSKLVLLAVAVLGLSACTKKPNASSPEAALQSYVNTAFSLSTTSDKQKLVGMSTGDAKALLEKMSDDDFKKRFLETKLELVSFKTKDQRKEESGDVSLVYELSYKDNRGGNTAVYSNKKIAYLTLIDNEWKIKATKDVKSFVDKKEDLLITPEPTAK